MLEKENAILSSINEPVYDFIGQHWLASYTKCDHLALCDLNGLERAMENAIKASGATLLNSVKHLFANNGCTMLFLLSESHASIHTYPEHNSCFIDIFTCGISCSSAKFNLALQEYLHPKEIISQIILRKEKYTDQHA